MNTGNVLGVGRELNSKISSKTHRFVFSIVLSSDPSRPLEGDLSSWIRSHEKESRENKETEVADSFLEGKL